VRLSGIDSLATAKIDNVVNVTFAGGHRYSLDINGFGGGTFGPNRLSEGSGYIAFPTSTEELQLENTQSFNTVGRLGDNAGLCFFALGPLATSAIGTGNFSNGGVDGVAQIGGAFSRLRESRVLAWNANGTSEDLRVELATSSPVFGGAAAGARNVLGGSSTSGGPPLKPPLRLREAPLRRARRAASASDNSTESDARSQSPLPTVIECSAL
jgi:hypothetical protein